MTLEDSCFLSSELCAKFIGTQLAWRRNMTVFDAAALIGSVGLDEVLNIAQSEFKRKGGNAARGKLLVQVICDDAVGVNDPHQGGTNLKAELAVALAEWKRNDASEEDSSATVILSFFDDTAYGSMAATVIDLTIYRV